MHRLRAILKRWIAYCLYYSGILWVYRRAALRNRAIVLMYHRVLPPDADSFSSSGIVVSPSTFNANMEFLRKHFAPLSAADFQLCLERGHFPTGACLITFDDGWNDNEKYALTALQCFSVPAVLFVATEYVGTSRTFWQEQITRRVFALSRDPNLGRSTLTELGIATACDASAVQARVIARSFVDHLKSSISSEIERVAAMVSTACQQIGVESSAVGEDFFLDWNALIRMSNTGLITIGSHAHSHIPLPHLGRERAIAELQESILEIERRGLPTPRMFAYPNGEYDTSTMDCPRQVGLMTAFTTQRGYVKPGDDAARLPRVNIHESAASTPPEFLCRMLGIF